MSDLFWSLVYATAEYQSWQKDGWNTFTVTAQLLAVFTITETYGIVVQGREIWRERSGASVSVTTNLFFFSFFFVAAIFGWYEKSAAMVFNAVVTGVAQIPIVIGLLRFKGFTRQEWLSAALFGAMMGWEVYTPHKSFWYLVFSFGLWYSLYMQLKELWDSGKTGVLNGQLLLVFLVSSGTWTAFAFAGENPYFKLSQVGIITLFSAITALWCWFWIKEQRARNPRTNLPVRKWIEQILNS